MVNKEDVLQMIKDMEMFTNKEEWKKYHNL